jgi:hypothetical protein
VDPGQQLARVLPAGAGGPLAAPDMGIAEPGDPVVAIQPSVITVAPGSTWRVRKGRSGPAEASGRISIRQRPYPRGCLTSTATPTSDFLPLARPPGSPASSPPMKVSSTSTVPDSRSRPGRTSTERSRCSIARAVGYEPISSDRCRLSAETPSLGASGVCS